jgi:hypothetical protein
VRVEGVEGESVAIPEAPEAILWDSFVEERARLAVEGFRKIGWPNINKGLRLRPFDLGTVEAEDPTPPEVPAKPSLVYVCQRHGTDKKGFATWKGYIRHCEFYKEVIELDPPAEVLEEAKTFPFYCFNHNKGFTTSSGAQHHATTEKRKPGKGFHSTVEEMRLNKEE